MDHAGESWPIVSHGAKRARPHAGREPTKASGRASCKSCLTGAMQCSNAALHWSAALAGGSQAACYITFLCCLARVAPVTEDDCAREVQPAARPGAARQHKTRYMICGLLGPASAARRSGRSRARRSRAQRPAALDKVPLSGATVHITFRKGVVFSG